MTFFTSLHLLNFKLSALNHTDVVDCVKLSEKYSCHHGPYCLAKSEYFQSQCSKCQHQWRIKRNRKCVDKLVRKYKCLFVSWDLNRPLTLFFSNGSIVYLELNSENNTLLNIEIDNHLCGKFLPSRITDVLVCQNCIYITYTEPKLTLIQINQHPSSLLDKLFGRKKGKLFGFEPKILSFDLCGHKSKSLEKKLSLNIQGDLLLVWWKNCNDDVWPWTPVKYITDRVNMLIYSINGTCLDLLCSVKVQDELLSASFSKEYSNQIFALEEIKKDQETVVNVCTHEIINDKCQLVYTTKLPVKGRLMTFHWSFTEDKLVAADSEGLLLVYDSKKKSTIVTNLEFIPKHLSWHPQNCIVLVVCRNNHTLCFDAALSLLNLKLCYKSAVESKFLDLDSYFCDQISIQKIMWQVSTFNDTCLLMLDSELSSLVFLKFSFGCITRYNITAFEIISQYLKSNTLDEAILVLRSLDWSQKGDIKFQCLSKIVNCLMRKPLSFQTLAGIELALGTFYDWVEILPKRIVEMYEHKLHHLARRFFHHLLRYHKFRKAFLLAVDLDSQDLFLDLYHVAKQKGEDVLAAVALHKAEEFDSSESCSESCSSDCPSESSSVCNDSAYVFPHQNHFNDDVLWTHHVDTPAESKRLQTNQEKVQYISSSNHQFGSNSENFIESDPFSHCEMESHPSSSMLNFLPQHSVCAYETEAPITGNPSKMFAYKNNAFDNRTSIHKMTVRNPVIEEESEEMEGRQIKLAHLGVI